MKDTLTEVAYELRHYIPAADAYQGVHVHKSWSKRIEQGIAEKDAEIAALKAERDNYLIDAIAYAGGRDATQARNNELLAALKIARQFMSIAADWNVDEAEIDGQIGSTYDWLRVVDKAINNEGKP